MRRLALILAALAVFLAGCGGSRTTRPHFWLTPGHGHKLSACVSSDCGQWSATLNWVIPSFPNTTGYDMFLNGTQIGSATSSPFTFYGSDCAATNTLGVRAHDGSGNHGPLWTTSYTSPACPTGATGGVAVGAPTPAGVTCTGSPLNAGANVQTALSAASPGSTVCLNPGAWSAISISNVSPASPGVTLAATPGQTVNVPGFTLSSDNNLTVEGFYIENQTTNGITINNQINGGLVITHNTIDHMGTIYGSLSTSIQPGDGIRTNLPTNPLSKALSGSVWVLNASDHHMQNFPVTSASVGATSAPLNSTTCNPAPPTPSPCIPTETFPAGSLLVNGSYGIIAQAGGSTSNTQNGVSITYNQFTDAATFLEVQGNNCACASADTNWDISHNVMGTGMGWGSSGHYIEGQWIGATINNNAFIGPQWFSPVAHSNAIHCYSFFNGTTQVGPGCQNVTMDNNIFWHAQSRAQTVLITDNNLTNITISNDLLVDDPQCNSLLGGTMDCPAMPWEVDKASGLTITNDTSANAAWSINMSQNGDNPLPNPGNYDIEKNIATGPALSGQSNYGSYGCVTAPCVAQNNVSQDNSATGTFGAGNFNNWTPNWQDTTWTWASNGATPPWTPPPADYYKPVVAGSVTSSMGWQGSICTASIRTSCIGP